MMSFQVSICFYYVLPLSKIETSDYILLEQDKGPAITMALRGKIRKSGQYTPYIDINAIISLPLTVTKIETL